MPNLQDWIVGERATKDGWCLIHLAEPGCVIWLAEPGEDGFDTSDPEVAIKSVAWLGEEGDADTIVETALDVLAIYDFEE